ncbi:MAG: type pilus assembly protein PilB [Actinomycetota bacterium]|nr:type pilus assembly protein PilB [Actinomycetota bacterium]
MRSPRTATRSVAPQDAIPGGPADAVPDGTAHPAAATSAGASAGSAAAPAVGPSAVDDAAGDKRLLGEILVDRRQLTPGQLSEALVQQRVSGKRLGALLVELGALDERDLADALGEHFGLPVVDLRHTPADEAAIGKLAESTARSLSALPLRLDDGVLEIAVADPNDDLAAELARAAGMPVRLVVSAATDIKRAIDQRYRALAAIGLHIDAFEATGVLNRRPETAAAALASTSTESAPVVQVVNLLITQALRDRASDVHVEPMGDTVRVRFRIDGVLHDVVALPAAMGHGVVSRIKVLAGMNIVERRRPQDGQIAMNIDGRAIDIRVASTGTIAGEKVVMRILDKTKPLFRLAELGMTESVAAVYGGLVRSPFGMVICAGPTGCGKTTSLYATLTELNSAERNIMTIEDPVEYVFPSINQIQINDQAGIDFASGLRSILRQDPDVILVGEIRDAETAHIAVQSALTGHFVLSSLHATDASAALLRVLDMNIEPFVVASSVIAVLSQRLVRRICGQCREPYSPTPAELEFFRDAGGVQPVDGFWHGAGCTFCAQTGYQDRIGVYELLQLSPEMKTLVTTKPTYERIRALAQADGMRTLREEAVRLVAEGVTTVSEVLRSIYML